jgi:hypothetical protein
MNKKIFLRKQGPSLVFHNDHFAAFLDLQYAGVQTTTMSLARFIIVELHPQIAQLSFNLCCYRFPTTLIMNTFRKTPQLWQGFLVN